MNSNSHKNDILLRNMIYGFRRMIHLLRKHDIISVPSYAAGIYHPPQVDIISKIYHPFRRGTDIIEKSTCNGRCFFHGRGTRTRTQGTRFWSCVSCLPDGVTAYHGVFDHLLKIRTVRRILTLFQYFNLAFRKIKHNQSEKFIRNLLESLRLKECHVKAAYQRDAPAYAWIPCALLRCLHKIPSHYVSLYVWLKTVRLAKSRNIAEKMSVARAATPDCYVSRKIIECRPAVPMCA